MTSVFLSCHEEKRITDSLTDDTGVPWLRLADERREFITSLLLHFLLDNDNDNLIAYCSPEVK